MQQLRHDERLRVVLETRRPRSTFVGRLSRRQAGANPRPVVFLKNARALVVRILAAWDAGFTRGGELPCRVAAGLHPHRLDGVALNVEIAGDDGQFVLDGLAHQHSVERIAMDGGELGHVSDSGLLN